MATFVKLTRIHTKKQQWVNLDLVQHMQRMASSRAMTYNPELPECTLIVFGPPNTDDPFSNSVEVLETPEAILSLSTDPGPSGYPKELTAF